eukprot:6394880-Amphidinium_carterae.1
MLISKPRVYMRKSALPGEQESMDSERGKALSLFRHFCREGRSARIWRKCAALAAARLGSSPNYSSEPGM